MTDSALLHFLKLDVAARIKQADSRGVNSIVLREFREFLGNLQELVSPRAEARTYDVASEGGTLTVTRAPEAAGPRHLHAGGGRIWPVPCLGNRADCERTARQDEEIRDIPEAATGTLTATESMAGLTPVYQAGASEAAAPVGSVTLPTEFWYHARHGNKIKAIKILREVTRIGLRDGKDIVDAIRVATPRSLAPKVFQAGDQPVGTVIRTRVPASSSRTFWAGYVFQKEATGAWTSSGMEQEFDDHKITDFVRANGYDVLYIPEETHD